MAFNSQMAETVCGSQQFLAISQRRATPAARADFASFPLQPLPTIHPVLQSYAKGEGNVPS